MIEIKYDDRQVLDALQELSRRIGDLTPVMRSIAGVLEDASARAFENERDPSTEVAWQPLIQYRKTINGQEWVARTKGHHG